MKKIVWTALATAVSALAARLAVRALSRVWCEAAKEPPPKSSGVTKFVVGKTIKSGI